MKFAFRTICFITPVSLAAFCIMRLKQTLSTEVDLKMSVTQNGAPSALTDSPDNLMWFVQISDLHLSIFQEKDRVVELREFCDQTLKIIKPPVVLATGDLTDAKLKDLMGSKQLLDEWLIYEDVLKKCGVTKFTKWLDIRGNHDNFDVPGVSSPYNLFAKYSVQGKHHQRSYMHVEKVGSQRYSFIGVDACPDQGLKRPFNFIGYLPSNEISDLKAIDEEASRVSNYSVWFGHYPSSCIIKGETMREIIGSRRNSLAYLCGHYHALFGVVPQMHTIQKEHFLELELADWKDNRMFRVAAIDHGMFSFVDVKHREWPIILVTNPKHALYRLQLKEPNLIKSSSHIRILVFSPNDVSYVKVKIDDGTWEKCSPHIGNQNLYIRKWDPVKYNQGIHRISVMAVDKLGRERTIDQPFSMDGTHSDFDVLPRLVLMLTFSTVLKFFFYSSVFFCAVPLCIFRGFGRLKCEPLLRLRRGFVKDWVRRFWLLSHSGWLFLALASYPVYVAVGPWAIGEVMDGYLGLIFIWGTYVNSQFIPELSTYGHGFIQVAIFHFPLIIFTAYGLDQRRRQIERVRPNNACSYVNAWLFNGSFLLMLLCQCWMAFIFWKAYGLSAVALGPVRTWPILMTIGLWYYTKTFPATKLRELITAWKQMEEQAMSKSHT